MKKILFYILISSSLLLSSCSKCDEPYNVINLGISVTFKDAATGNYLYPSTNGGYNKDSLQLLDINGNLLSAKYYETKTTTLPYQYYYYFNFHRLYNPQTDDISFNEEVCREFIIRYNAAESDTIQLCFKSKEAKCGSYFETIKVYHDNEQLHNPPAGDVTPDIAILKD